MSTFTSKFKGLPKSAQLRALAGAVIPAKESLPFSRLPEESFERKYLSTVYDILTKGRAKSSRPGQNTLMLDDVQFSVDISNHKIPLLTTRYVPYKSFIVETLWMLSGDTNIRFLKEHGVSIWDDWVEPGTELFETADTFTVQEMQNYLRLCEQATYKGWCDYKSAQVTGRAQLSDIESFLKTIGKGLKDFPCRRLVAGSIGTGAYGAQWRKWKDLRAVTGKIAQMLTDRGSHNHIGLAKFNNATGSADLVSTEVDQISDVIKMLKKSPDSRRIIVSAWNPVQIPDVVLPPCHCFFQFISTVNENTEERELTLKLTQRSSDFLLGAAFNIPQYAVIAHLVAKLTGHKATKLIYSPTDCHIYEDQLPFVLEHLMREPIEAISPRLDIDVNVKNLNKLSPSDIRIEGYNKDAVHPNIPYPVAV